jgi:pimeloyl-ACP methyl ester carboxylesterase
LTLMLRFFGRGRSYEEIAQLTAVPVGTVRSRFNAARATLAERLLATVRTHEAVGERTETWRVRLADAFEALNDGDATRTAALFAADAVIDARARAGGVRDVLPGLDDREPARRSLPLPTRVRLDRLPRRPGRRFRSRCPGRAHPRADGGRRGRALRAARDRSVQPARRTAKRGTDHIDVPVRLLVLSSFNGELTAYFFSTLAPSYDLGPRLAEITAPTLVLVGSYDWVCPPVASRVLGDGIPGARLVELADAGHFGFSETPDAFLEPTRPHIAFCRARFRSGDRATVSSWQL